MTVHYQIRPFHPEDADRVRQLFVDVNRDLAPENLRAAFDAYVARCLEEEFADLATYYGARNGAFFVADSGSTIIGMYGLEQVEPGVVELRRMYAATDARGIGLGRALFAHAVENARKRQFSKLILSTSEVQPAALALYRSAGLTELPSARAEAQTTKTIGAGINRYYFEKQL